MIPKGIDFFDHAANIQSYQSQWVSPARDTKHINHIGCFGLFGYEGPLRNKPGRGKKSIKKELRLHLICYHRSVIDTAFVSDIVPRMVAI